jgi:PBSX family phage terminase large subunit
MTWWTDASPYRDCDGLILDGSIRSGKTIAEIEGFFGWSQARFSNQNFILSGVTINALYRNVLRPAFQTFDAKGIGYNYNRSNHELNVGSNTYFCFGANNEASQDVVQGLTSAGWLGDEVALQPQSFIEQVIGRCSVPGSKFWLNCNPESPYHHVKTEIIDKAEEKNFLRLHFTMNDNPALTPEIRARYERMFAGVFYRRYVLGEWCMAEGAIYDMLDPGRHVVDDLPQILKRWVGIDYGTGTVTTFWMLGLGADNKLYFLDYWRHDVSQTLRQMTDVQFADALNQWIGDRCVEWVVVPSDAASFIAHLLQAKAKRELLNIPRVLVDPRKPGSVLSGIRDVGALLQQDRLLFARDIERRGGLSEWMNYSWDPKAQERGEDAPLKLSDHSCDAGRYVIASVKHLWRRHATSQSHRAAAC